MLVAGSMSGYQASTARKPSYSTILRFVWLPRLNERAVILENPILVSLELVTLNIPTDLGSRLRIMLNIDCGSVYPLPPRAKLKKVTQLIAAAP